MGAQISLNVRLRLHYAFVLPVLTYNMGTWGLTKAELTRLDAHHRRHLRQILGVRWPHRMSNEALYRQCHAESISTATRAARWSLFGHVQRLPADDPPSVPLISTWRTPTPQSSEADRDLPLPTHWATTCDALDVSCAAVRKCVHWTETGGDS